MIISKIKYNHIFIYIYTYTVLLSLLFVTNNEWCNNTGATAICGWADNRSAGVKMNRKTLGWSAAAASFAYGFGKLSEIGFAWVGADQLIGGPYPDNEPAVAGSVVEGRKLHSFVLQFGGSVGEV